MRVVTVARIDAHQCASTSEAFMSRVSSRRCRRQGRGSTATVTKVAAGDDDFASVERWGIRAVRRSDFEGVLETCAKSGVDWSPEAILDDCEKAVTSPSSSLTKVLIAVPAPGEAQESNSRAVGAVGFCVVVAGETQVTQIVTLPGIRRRGLGQRMLRALIGIDPRSVAVLEVKSTNSAALAMYTKCGFVESNRRRAYYADGSDAICMMREPEEAPVSTRELTRLLAGLSRERARAEAPPLPENVPAEVRPVVDVPRERAFIRQKPSTDGADEGGGGFKMRNRIRRK